MYDNILLSTDGSDVARSGVKHGITLAKSLNAKVTVITVTEPLDIDYGDGTSTHRRERRSGVFDRAIALRSISTQTPCARGEATISA